MFSTFFSRNFSIFHIFLDFFSKYWNVNELDIFGSGEFHEYSIVTEHLRILIHISNYFQTLEIIMEKTLSDKTEPFYYKPKVPNTRRSRPVEVREICKRA